MKILGFIEYISEGSSVEVSAESKIISQIVDTIIKSVEKAKVPEENYYKIADLEFHEDSLYFDLRVYLKVSSDPDFTKDSYFKKQKWHKIKFDREGFAIDANSFISENNVPEIEITILLDRNSDSGPHGVYPPDIDGDRNTQRSNLYNKLQSIVYHEITHLNQIGLNREPFNVNVTSKDLRKASQNNYKYFILPEEIEAMVGGMHRRAKLEDIPLDTIFMDHLKPYLRRKFLNKRQMEAIILIWIKYSLENYPGARFTDKYINFINNN